MTAFPKADVQNVLIGIGPNVRFRPEADIRGLCHFTMLPGLHVIHEAANLILSVLGSSS